MADDEETKGEAGGAEEAEEDEVPNITHEERQYEEAVADLDDARNDFREAKNALQQWKADHAQAGYALSDPDLVQLKLDVNDANQRLKDANQLLKDARAAAEKAEHAVSRNKHLQYKGMSVEASCRKYLDAIAKQLATVYDFPKQYRNPTIGDVFRAINIDDNTWRQGGVKRKRGTAPVLKTLPDFFDPADWAALRKLNRDTNNRIHDGRLRVTSSGKSFIVLPHSDFRPDLIARVQRIAQESGLVTDTSAIVVKDEKDLNSSSNDSSQ